MEYTSDISEPLNSWSSIYQAESKAIEVAALTLLNNNIMNEEISIYSDSQSVLKSLTKKNITNQFILDCHTALNELGKTNKIEIIWIPGHSGYQGNEKADFLAKEGSKKQIEKQHYEIPMSRLKLEIENYSKRNIRREYEKTSENTHKITNQLLIASKQSLIKLRKEFLKTRTEDIATLSRVLSGHNNLNHHQRKMGLSFETGCEYCGDKKIDETAEHIITKCPKFAQKRHEYFGDFYCATEDIGCKTKLPKLKRNIIKFFKKIDVLNKPLKLTKRDLSPSRSWRQRKRKDSTEDTKNTKRQKTD